MRSFHRSSASRPSRFALGRLDPLSALLLIRTFELARTDIQPESTCIGLKDRLVSAFAHLVKEFRPSCPEHSSHYHDGLDEHNDPSREPPFLSLDPVCNPSRDELYRGFLLYTRGLATRQAFQDVDEVSQIIKIDAAWRTRCRKAIGLGPATVLLIDRAAEDRVLERYSWKAWKDEVLGGKKEEKREEEFVRDLPLLVRVCGCLQDRPPTLVLYAQEWL